MSKVEELRGNLISVLSEVWGGSNAVACSAVAVDSLIAAAKEEEREYIKAFSEEVESRDGTQWLVPASVLSPDTKEEK